ncbi:hypothetical protein F01_320042 [Burkholderia cenocepacia]|nr:hypothetical protein F01_320042 [Burkholderia cenocepacia]
MSGPARRNIDLKSTIDHRGYEEIALLLHIEISSPARNAVDFMVFFMAMAKNLCPENKNPPDFICLY